MEIEAIEIFYTNDEMREEKFAWSFLFSPPFSSVQLIFPIPKTILKLLQIYFYKS